MSFKDHDKKTFIADTARAYASRRISKRDFMKKMAMAGVGFSAFSAGMLGNTPYHALLGGFLTAAALPFFIGWAETLREASLLPLWTRLLLLRM